MKITKAELLGVWVPALALAAPQLVFAADFYRYINEEGNTVVDYQVPPEHIKQGYEVLNEKGVVIRVVPRELTPEEQKLADAEELRQARALAEEQRLREWDESLLLRYSTVEDIEAAKERALRDLKIRVSILKGNKRSLKQQVENYQQQAAEMERLGKEVDVAHVSSIENLQTQIASTDRAIADRKKEIEAVESAYQEDIERFTMLQDMVEFRRAMTASEDEKFQDPRR